MKKIIIPCLLFGGFFFLLLLGAVAQETESTVNESTCSYTTEITEDEKLEEVRTSVENKLMDTNMVNAVLGIYKIENYENLDVIISAMNMIYEYTVNHQYNIDDTGYIQAYKFGVGYLDYLADKTNNLATAKAYQDEHIETNDDNKDDYKFFMRVLSAINPACSMSVDGLPIAKPYTITGWYPHYGKDGSGDEHYGIDIAVPMGTSVYAIADGEVIRTNNTCAPDGGYLGNECGGVNPGAGNYVFYKVIQDDKTLYIMGCHMSEVEVNAGDYIVQGQRIGTTGHSGNSEGAHYHIEIHSAESGIGSYDNGLNPCEVIEGLCEE